jgi:hypothetical protein
MHGGRAADTFRQFVSILPLQTVAHVAVVSGAGEVNARRGAARQQRSSAFIPVLLWVSLYNLWTVSALAFSPFRDCGSYRHLSARLAPVKMASFLAEI